MVKGFIHYKDARIPFVIQDYRMDLFTDDSILNAFIEEYNFRTDYVLTGECFDSGSISRKIILNVERTMGSTCYLNCFLINQIGYDSRFDSVTFKSDLLDCIFQYKYNYLDIARSGTNLSAETKEVYRIPFSIDRITESVTLGHIENYESMFTPQRFIEQIMAFEYLFEKLEPEKAKQRNFHLIDELELMLGVFPDVIAGVRKSARKIADEIKNLRVDIVHGHAYYYDFANDHNIQYYMLMLDKLIERMNLKLVGFNDEEIKTFRPY